MKEREKEKRTKERKRESEKEIGQTRNKSKCGEGCSVNGVLRGWFSKGVCIM